MKINLDLQQAVALVRKYVTTIPQALAVLDKFESQIDSSSTYEQLRKIEKEARALQVLMGEVSIIKQRSEVVVALALHRIGEEIKRVPKAGGPGRGKKEVASGRNLSGRSATGIKKDARSKLQKLASIPTNEIKRIAASLHVNGKDATPTAILGVLKQDEIRAERAAFEGRRQDETSAAQELEDLIRSNQKFGTIYADPPWSFEVYSGKGKQRSAERHYDTMSLEAIKNMPIDQLAADDCALFLWSVWPELPGAMDVIASWGFKYKTAAFVWVKNNPRGEGLHTGMGYWTRANTEPCLLATRGTPDRLSMNVHQVIMSPVGRHSAKPDDARSRIECLVGGPYLELFARKQTEGWTTWGNENGA